MTQAATAPLVALAELAGLQVDWHDAAGRPQRVRDAVLVTLLAALGLPAGSDAECEASRQRLAAERAARAAGPLVIGVVDEAIRMGPAASFGIDATDLAVEIRLEDGPVISAQGRLDEEGTLWIPGIRTHGYHQLSLGSQTLTLAVAPRRCFCADDLAQPTSEAPRLWGIASQIYALRRGQPCGLGDFSALADLAARAASAGASAIGINPVHANFAADPGRYSPYSPSSRLFFNPLYVDPVPLFGAAACAQAAAEVLDAEAWRALEAAPQIDWPRIAPARLAVLRLLFERRTALLNSERLAELQSFEVAGGEALLDHARFEAIDAHLRPQGIHAWQQWPNELRDPRSPAVAAFAAQNANEVRFHVFLQWLAKRSLGEVQEGARRAGMAVGLINDLAIGTDPSGSHAWSRQGEIVQGLVCGAPPDLYNPLGQSWGLTVFSPEAMHRTGYRAFIEMLRATLACCGGLRVDHVLGMMRLWLVPVGQPAADGAYLRYPFEDLLRLVALESWRHRAIIVGENLGTVPAGFNERLAQSGILGTTVLWFESDWNHGAAPGAPSRRFRLPREWPEASVATTTTHDLPTSRGWWLGQDIEWRNRLGLLDQNDSAEQQHRGRELDREALWAGLCSVGLAQGDRPAPDAAPLAAMLGFVALSRSPLVLFPVEDLIGEVEQPNVPGTTSGHPNWQRRLPVPLALLWDDSEVSARRAAITAARAASRRE